MSFRSIFTIGLLTLAITLAGVRMMIVNREDDEAKVPRAQKLYLSKGEKRTMDLFADQPGWIPVAYGPIDIECFGVIDIGGVESDPRGNVTVPGDAHALIPRLPYGAVVAKIGENGQPFAVEFFSQISMKEMVYVAINDSNYSDNTGAYTLIVTGRSR